VKEERASPGLILTTRGDIWVEADPTNKNDKKGMTTARKKVMEQKEYQD